MKYRYLLAVALVLATIRPAAAGPFLDWLVGWHGQHGKAPSCCPPAPCCPDDYCAKPLPCIGCPPHCVGPDDYCAKPLPCIPCLSDGPFLNCGTPPGCANAPSAYPIKPH